MAKRKDSKGRALPDGVSERSDGRYIYRYQTFKCKLPIKKYRKFIYNQRQKI